MANTHADYKVIFGTISHARLHAELCQRFAIQWHQLSDSPILLVPLVYNIGNTVFFFLCVCRPRARFQRAVSRMRRSDWTLTGNRPMNKLSTCKDFVDEFKLKLEHLCFVSKSCLTFELEYIYLLHVFVIVVVLL